MRDATRFVTSEIIGGQSAPSPIPWQVSIQGGVNCGGTILDAYTAQWSKRVKLIIGENYKIINYLECLVFPYSLGHF